MDLNGLLQRKREAIINRWIKTSISDYPPETQRFLLQKKDQFENPVGHALRTGLRELYDLIMEGYEPHSVDSVLDRIIRIRAVQDLRPSRAVGFVVALKQIIRDELWGKSSKEKLYEILRTIEDRCDEVALRAFDVYSQCREEINEIKVNEWRKRSVKILERINRFYERRGQKVDLQDEGPRGLT